MPYSVWQAFITDGGEQVVPAATIDVYLEASGAPATIYDGPSGASLGSSTVSGADGLAKFFAPAGAYKIVATKGAFTKEFRHVQLGNAAARDTGVAFDNVPTVSDADTLYPRQADLDAEATARAVADAATLTSAQAYADGLVVGLLDDRGNHDASGNVFPSTGGSGAAGAIKKGDLWTISVAGTLGGKVATIGDAVRALVDAPGQTAANWAQTENNIGYVPENSANKSTSLSSPDDTKFPTTKAVADALPYRGTYTTLAALQSAVPTGDAGDYAYVDTGAGGNANEYIWDANEGWVMVGLSAIPTMTMLGNNTVGSAVPAALTQAQVLALLGLHNEWNYVFLPADFTSTTATPVDVTGFGFTAPISTKYIEIEVRGRVSSNNVNYGMTVYPQDRTGEASGANASGSFRLPSSAYTTTESMDAMNYPATASVATTASQYFEGNFMLAPSGSARAMRIQLRGESALGSYTIYTGYTFLRWRELP